MSEGIKVLVKIVIDNAELKDKNTDAVSAAGVETRNVKLILENGSTVSELVKSALLNADLYDQYRCVNVTYRDEDFQEDVYISPASRVEHQSKYKMVVSKLKNQEDAVSFDYPTDLKDLLTRYNQYAAGNADIDGKTIGDVVELEPRIGYSGRGAAYTAVNGVNMEQQMHDEYAVMRNVQAQSPQPVAPPVPPVSAMRSAERRIRDELVERGVVPHQSPSTEGFAAFTVENLRRIREQQYQQQLQDQMQMMQPSSYGSESSAYGMRAGYEVGGGGGDPGLQGAVGRPKSLKEFVLDYDTRARDYDLQTRAAYETGMDPRIARASPYLAAAMARGRGGGPSSAFQNNTSHPSAMDYNRYNGPQYSASYRPSSSTRHSSSSGNSGWSAKRSRREHENGDDRGGKNKDSTEPSDWSWRRSRESRSGVSRWDNDSVERIRRSSEDTGRSK